MAKLLYSLPINRNDNSGLFNTVINEVAIAKCSEALSDDIWNELANNLDLLSEDFISEFRSKLKVS